MKPLALFLITVLILSSCSRDNDDKKPTNNKVYSFTDDPAIIGEWEAKYPEKEYYSSAKRWVFDSKGNFNTDSKYSVLDRGTYTYKRGYLKTWSRDKKDKKDVTGLPVDVKGNELKIVIGYNYYNDGREYIDEYIRVK